MPGARGAGRGRAGGGGHGPEKIKRRVGQRAVGNQCLGFFMNAQLCWKTYHVLGSSGSGNSWTNRPSSASARAGKHSGSAVLESFSWMAIVALGVSGQDTSRRDKLREVERVVSLVVELLLFLHSNDTTGLRCESAQGNTPVCTLATALLAKKTAWVIRGNAAGRRGVPGWSGMASSPAGAASPRKSRKKSKTYF